MKITSDTAPRSVVDEVNVCGSVACVDAVRSCAAAKRDDHFGLRRNK
jgi:hypothetical protein